MNHSTVSASTASAQTFSIKKTALAGMLVALTVALSGFSIPIGASKCFPIQHLVNVLAGVFLGPVYGVSMAFCVSLIRNILAAACLLFLEVWSALFWALIYSRKPDVSCSLTSVR